MHPGSLTSELHLWGRAKLGAQWVLARKGLGTTNFFETGAFLRTRDDVEHPNMQYEFLPITRKLRGGKLVPVPGFQVWMDLCRPESRGAVTLQSAEPAHSPSIVFNHLQAEQDMRDLIDGVRLVRNELIRQPAWEKFQPVELNPGPDVLSDQQLEAFVRSHCSTSYHASGTCRMGVDHESVVDQEARVRAVGNLRVVDASIMPKVVSANINAPLIMIAEKISDRIRGVTPLPATDVTYYGGPGQQAPRPVPSSAQDRT